MVVIRLARNGKKKDPIYKVMVSNKDHAATGRFIEKLGVYNPKKAHEGGFTFDKERYAFWLKQGAVPSQTVSSLVKKLEKGVFDKPKVVKAKKSKEDPKKAAAEKTEDAVKKEAAPKAEAPKADAKEAVKKEVAPKVEAKDAVKKEAAPKADTKDAAKKNKK